MSNIDVMSTQQMPMLQVKNLKKHFPIIRGLSRKVVGTLRAVDGVNFTIYAHHTLGLVGESGCGKSTLMKILIGDSQSNQNT